MFKGNCYICGEHYEGDSHIILGFDENMVNEYCHEECLEDHFRAIVSEEIKEL